MPRLAVHDPKGSCTPKRPAPSLCTARVYGGRIPRSLVHTRSRAARQRPMQGGALHHRAFCVNFWIESLPGSNLACDLVKADESRFCPSTPSENGFPAPQTVERVIDRLGLLVAVWATAAFALNQPARLVLT